MENIFGENLQNPQNSDPEISSFLKISFPRFFFWQKKNLGIWTEDIPLKGLSPGCHSNSEWPKDFFFRIFLGKSIVKLFFYFYLKKSVFFGNFPIKYFFVVVENLIFQIKIKKII